MSQDKTRRKATGIIYQGPVFSVRVDHLPRPDGGDVQRDVIVHPGAAAVVALDTGGQVSLVRQYRHPAGKALLEIPAGLIKPQEEAAACAARELAEEVGLRAGRMQPLAAYYSTPGCSDEYVSVFLATHLSAVPTAADEDEVLEVVKMPLAEALALALAGEVEDAKTLIGLLATDRRLKAQGGPASRS